MASALRAQRNLYEDAVSWVATCLGVGNALLGLVLFLMPQRVNSSPSFQFILSVAPAKAWGVMFMVGGIAALVGQFARRSNIARASHTLACLMCMWWVVAFCIAGYQVPTTSVTGVFAYGMIAVCHGILAAVSPVRDDLR